MTQNPKLKDQDYTDWHCHILPGLDDGAATVDDALEIGRILGSFGFSHIHCTPHFIRGSYAATPSVVRKAVLDLQMVFDAAGIPLVLSPGLEYYMDEYLLPSLDEPRPLGESRILLVELPISADPLMVKETTFQMILKDFVPLIAHPERCKAFEAGKTAIGTKLKGLIGAFGSGSRKSGRLLDKSANATSTPVFDNPLLTILKEMGCLFQGNIGSFAGIYGDHVRKRALTLLESGLYSKLGTDAHNPKHLEKWLATGIGEIERVIGKDALHGLLQ